MKSAWFSCPFSYFSYSLLVFHLHQPVLVFLSLTEILHEQNKWYLIPDIKLIMWCRLTALHESHSTSRLCIQTLGVYCPTSKLPQCSLAAAHVMEERKWTASFSFGSTQVNSLLHSKSTQVVSSFHGVTLPWNQRTLSSLHPQKRQMLPYLQTAKREAGREALCLPCFSLTPTLCSS